MVKWLALLNLDYKVSGLNPAGDVSSRINSTHDCMARHRIQPFIITIRSSSDLIIPELVTNKTAKICCRGLMLALFYSTMVIKNYFG